MKQVFISAGHDSKAPGCVANGHKEADLTVYLRDRIAAHLAKMNVPFVTDGRTGVNLPLKDAIKMAKENTGPSIEIHFNGSEDEKARGVEVLAQAELKPLAQQLAAAVSTVLQTPLRGILGYRPTNAGQHERLGFCEAGGAVLEVCFMTNSAELNNYLFNDEGVAIAIARVLAKAANT